MAVIIGGNVLNIFIIALKNIDILLSGDVLNAVKYENNIAVIPPVIVANIAINRLSPMPSSILEK